MEYIGQNCSPSRLTCGKDGRSTVCSFCERPILWRKYADHLDRVHPGGRVAPLPSSTKTMADLLMEGAEDGTLFWIV
jgi:hypothetical protein